VPLALVAVVGLIVGLVNGNTVESFTAAANTGSAAGNGLFAAVIATIFAYEGWIIATSINAELKNAKRTLPLALLFGCAIIVAIYILYFIGLAGAAPVDKLMNEGATVAFRNLFAMRAQPFSTSSWSSPALARSTASRSAVHAVCTPLPHAVRVLVPT
jgi:APA family basic amino acid/polyamine antiporter